jgi:hypothetical protein
MILACKSFLSDCFYSITAFQLYAMHNADKAQWTEDGTRAGSPPPEYASEDELLAFGITPQSNELISEIDRQALGINSEDKQIVFEPDLLVLGIDPEAPCVGKGNRRPKKPILVMLLTGSRILAMKCFRTLGYTAVGIVSVTLCCLTSPCLLCYCVAEAEEEKRDQLASARHSCSGQ